MRNITEFEGLRGVLSVLVVLIHVYPPLVSWLWGSMDIFFCLSGFLIGQMLLKGLGQPRFVSHYVWRRITRIWPAYYVTLAAGLGMMFCFAQLSRDPSPWPATGIVLLHVVFLQNTELIFDFGADAAGHLSNALAPIAHTWSVALEEQFYLLSPLICWLLLRTKRPATSALILAGTCIGFGTVLRLQGLNWWTLPARFDGFAAGLAAAVLVTSHGGPVALLAKAPRIIYAAIGTGGLTLLTLYSILPTPKAGEASFQGTPFAAFGVAAFSIFAAGSIVLIAARSGRRVLAVLRWSPLKALGRMSYSTYLAHVPLLKYLGLLTPHWPPLPDSFLLPAKFISCFGAAYLLYVFVERPVMRRREASRTFRSPSVFHGGVP